MMQGQFTLRGVELFHTNRAGDDPSGLSRLPIPYSTIKLRITKLPFVLSLGIDVPYRFRDLYSCHVLWSMGHSSEDISV